MEKSGSVKACKKLHNASYVVCFQVYTGFPCLLLSLDEIPLEIDCVLKIGFDGEEETLRIRGKNYRVKWLRCEKMLAYIWNEFDVLRDLLEKAESKIKSLTQERDDLEDKVIHYEAYESLGGHPCCDQLNMKCNRLEKENARLRLLEGVEKERDDLKDRVAHYEAFGELTW